MGQEKNKRIDINRVFVHILIEKTQHFKAAIIYLALIE